MPRLSQSFMLGPVPHKTNQHRGQTWQLCTTGEQNAEKFLVLLLKAQLEMGSCVKFMGSYSLSIMSSL
eukprot:60157-Amphidinium_carterae.1